MRIALYKITQAILSGTSITQRETAHTDENGYIQFCNLCDDGHYLRRALPVDFPATRWVRRRHSHSSGPCGK